MKPQKLDTIWEVPDELWQRIEPILLADAPPKPTGRKRANWRRVLDGILFRMRSGCQWNQLPKEFGGRTIPSRSWPGDLPQAERTRAEAAEQAPMKGKDAL
jgi:transposase